MNKYRTHNCSELNVKNIGIKTKLSGWIQRKRDHGNLLFIDIRDHFGITQCDIENKACYPPINFVFKVTCLKRKLDNMYLSRRD